MDLSIYIYIYMYMGVRMFVLTRTQKHHNNWP